MMPHKRKRRSAPQDEVEVPEEETFPDVVKRSKEEAGGKGLRVFIIYPNWEHDTFSDAFSAGNWFVAMKDKPTTKEKEPDYYILGTDSTNKTTGLYKHSWEELPLNEGGKVYVFHGSEEPLKNPSTHRHIKGVFQPLVFTGEYYNVHTETILEKSSGGYKLPAGLLKDYEHIVDDLAIPSASSPQGSDSFLLSLLNAMSINVPVGSIDTKLFNKTVFTGGAIVESDDERGFDASLVTAIHSSEKGRGAIHAEEKVLADLAKGMESKKTVLRTTGTRLHMVLIVIIAAGEEGGFMCSSCVCSLAKFHIDFGLDATKLRVVYASRPRDDRTGFVSPQSAFRELVKNQNKMCRAAVLQNLVFFNSKMNGHGVSDTVKEIGKEVREIVQTIVDRCEDSSPHCWTHCCYHGYGPNQHPYEKGSKLSLENMSRQELLRLRTTINSFLCDSDEALAETGANN